MQARAGAEACAAAQVGCAEVAGALINRGRLQRGFVAGDQLGKDVRNDATREGRPDPAADRDAVVWLEADEVESEIVVVGVVLASVLVGEFPASLFYEMRVAGGVESIENPGVEMAIVRTLRLAAS